MKKLWDLKKVFSNLELEGQGHGIIMWVTRLLLLGPFYTIQTKRDQTFWKGVYKLILNSSKGPKENCGKNLGIVLNLTAIIYSSKITDSIPCMYSTLEVEMYALCFLIVATCTIHGCWKVWKSRRVISEVGESCNLWPHFSPSALAECSALTNFGLQLQTVAEAVGSILFR